jgi:hypothetical protein
MLSDSKRQKTRKCFLFFPFPLDLSADFSVLVLYFQVLKVLG